MNKSCKLHLPYYVKEGLGDLQGQLARDARLENDRLLTVVLSRIQIHQKNIIKNYDTFAETLPHDLSCKIRR